MEKFALSDSVYLKALLVDPSRARRGAEPNIVGYRFHATRDLPRVPDFGTTGAFSLNNLYDYENQDQWRTVNAGEDFDLTLYELIIFASLPEISCSIDGQNPDINVEQHLSVVLRERGGIPAVKLAAVDSGLCAPPTRRSMSSLVSASPSMMLWAQSTCE